MQIIIRENYVEIEGYVNAVERKSKPLMSRLGKFVEKISKGAFKRALERADNVNLMLNHNKVIGGTKEGNLELTEDNIGLHARATITDADVIEKAMNGELVGWSFGFHDKDVEQKQDESGMQLRNVKDLILEEVSILDRTRTPAYDGTLLAVRDDSSIFYGEVFEDKEMRIERHHIREKEPNHQANGVKINYDKWDALIEDMKQ